MPTQITQLDDEENDRSILRVEGQLLRDDAELLGRIATDLTNSSGREIVLDLADVDFIDSEAASVLKHLQFSNIFEITGVEILLQNAVNEVERHDLE